MRIRRETSFLLVVDVQTRLAPAVAGQTEVIARCGALLDAARLLDVPALASEHCPEGIGPLVPELRARLGDGRVVRKTHFSCADEPALHARMAELHRRQAVVCGMETHVCVMQSALGLAERGFEVYVVADACGSRRAEDRAAALARLSGDGIRAVTAEMTLFEWMHRADAPGFRELLEIVKRC